MHSTQASSGVVYKDPCPLPVVVVEWNRVIGRISITTVSNSIDFFPFLKVTGVITPLRRVIALSFFVVPEHT